MLKFFYTAFGIIAILFFVVFLGGYIIHVAEDRSMIETWQLTNGYSRLALIPSLVFGGIAFGLLYIEEEL